MEFNLLPNREKKKSLLASRQHGRFFWGGDDHHTDSESPIKATFFDIQGYVWLIV